MMCRLLICDKGILGRLSLGFGGLGAHAASHCVSLCDAVSRTGRPYTCQQMTGMTHHLTPCTTPASSTSSGEQCHSSIAQSKLPAVS
eukprot:scaffold178200_cov35-Prasinocladus_malaysianus.AAC.1